MERPDPDGPTLGADLPPTTRFALLAMRTAVAGEDGCPAYRAAFDRACGAAARQGEAALSLLVRLIALHGRRRVSVAPPASWRLTRDEQSFAAAFEAARTGHAAAVEAHLSWLLARTPPPTLTSALELLAQALGGSAPAAGSMCPPQRGYQAWSPAAAAP